MGKEQQTKLELTKLIDSFRALESNVDSIPVLGDGEAMRVLVAWSKSRQTWSRPTGKVPTLTATNHAEVWAWVCRGWEVNYVEIARGAGLAVRTASEKMHMLMHNRLCYPDASISRAARTALDVFVAKQLKVKPRSKQGEEGEDRRRGDRNN